MKSIEKPASVTVNVTWSSVVPVHTDVFVFDSIRLKRKRPGSSSVARVVTAVFLTNLFCYFEKKITNTRNWRAQAKLSFNRRYK